jgi:hypothetical protein
MWAREHQPGVQDGHRSGVVADDQQQAVAHQHAAGFAALVDADQVGDAGAPDERECAHRPPGVNGTGKAAPLDPRGCVWRSTASCSRARS